MSTLLNIAKSVMSVLFVLFRYLFYRAISSFLTGIVLLFVAVLMFVTFHQAYMPVVSHVKPVYLQFGPECQDNAAVLCPYPEASILFTPENKANDERMLMRGQSYKVFLEIEMPPSPANEKLGMFMVNLKFLSAKGAVLKSSSRSCMLHYESRLVRLFRTLFFSLPLTLGLSEEKQKVEISFFEDYIDDSYNPAVQAKVVILTKQIEIYKSTLRLQASFTGLRYLIFNYPILFGCLAIVGNFITIALIYSACINQFSSSSQTFAVNQQLATHSQRGTALGQNGRIATGDSASTRTAINDPRQQERTTQQSTTSLPEQNAPPNSGPTSDGRVLHSQEHTALHRTVHGDCAKGKSKNSNRYPMGQIKLSRKQAKKKNLNKATQNRSDENISNDNRELDNDINSCSTSQDRVEVSQSKKVNGDLNCDNRAYTNNFENTVGHEMTTHHGRPSLHYPRLRKVQKLVKNRNSRRETCTNTGLHKKEQQRQNPTIVTNCETDLQSDESVTDDSSFYYYTKDMLKFPRVQRLGRYLKESIPGLTKHSRQCMSNLELSRITESCEKYPRKSASTSDLDQIENS